MFTNSINQILLYSLIPIKVAIFMFPTSLLAEDWLIGGWSHNCNCKHPDFVFKFNHALINGDADGNQFSFAFDGVKYAYKYKTALVDFGRTHGFLGAKSNQEIIFHKNEDNSILMDRKIRDRDISLVLFKCKKIGGQNECLSNDIAEKNTRDDPS